MSAAPPPIWNAVYPVRSYDVDARGRLAVAAIGNFLQDAAGCHAHALGVSIDQLRPLHLTWVLVRLRLQLERYPGWQDRLCIQTWPSQQDRLVSQRDFLLVDEADGEIGRCVTSWVVMDLRRWRPQRLTVLPSPLPSPDRPRALALPPDKIAPPAAGSHECHFQVGDRDLDRNGHVNNVRYIEWALETVPPKVLNTCGLETLAIDFVGEALLGDQVLAGCQNTHESPKTFHHGVRSASTGGDLARLMTRWRRLP